MYITLPQLSRELHSMMVGREISDLLWALWFIIRCSSTTCTKGVSFYFYLFIYFPQGSHNDDLSSALFPSPDLTLAQAAMLDIVFRCFFLVLKKREHVHYWWWILHTSALFLGLQRLSGRQEQMSQDFSIFQEEECNYLLRGMGESLTHFH